MACLVRRHSSPVLLFHTTCGGVVVAVRADRLPEFGVVAAVAGEAGQLAAVRAGFGVAAGVAGLRFAGAAGFAGASVSPHGPGVDGAEGGGGEGGEHGRVTADVFGNTFAADQPGADQLEGIPAVRLGAGRAGRRAAIAAGFVDHAVRQGRGRGGREDFPGGGVDAVDLAAEADGLSAPGGRPDVIEPPVVSAGVEVAGGEVFRWAGVVADGEQVAVAGTDERAVAGMHPPGAEDAGEAGCGVRPRARAVVGSGSGSQRRAGRGHGQLPASLGLSMVVTKDELVPGAVPQRCWAAWRVMPSRVPMSAQE